MRNRARPPLVLSVAACICFVALGLSLAIHSNRQGSLTNLGSAVPDPKAASWDKPWQSGNPQAARLGEAFQALDLLHPPVNASAVYWLGGPLGDLYPYVRAMLGHGAETMLSTVVYADKRTADLAHVSISAWDTRPLSGGVPSFGEGLAADFARTSRQHSGSYVWVAAANSTPGVEALIEVAPHTIVQLTRLDDQSPQLPVLISDLRPYPH
jgi:hypothetical protein